MQADLYQLEAGARRVVTRYHPEEERRCDDPNLPDASNLPEGVLTIGELPRSSSESESGGGGRSDQDKIGDQPGHPGGTMTNGPMTAITTMFGELLGDIADDSSATTVEEPADVQPLVQNFFSGAASNLGNLLLEFLLGGGAHWRQCRWWKPDHRHLLGLVWFGPG